MRKKDFPLFYEFSIIAPFPDFIFPLKIIFSELGEVTVLQDNPYIKTELYNRLVWIIAYGLYNRLVSGMDYTID